MSAALTFTNWLSLLAVLPAFFAHAYMWGPETPSRDWPERLRSLGSSLPVSSLGLPMLFSLLSVAVRRLLRILALALSDELSQKIEIMLLRHQLQVLARGRRIPLRRRDRVLLAAFWYLSAFKPLRPRWTSMS